MTPMRILSLSSSCNSIEIDSNISSWNMVKSSVVLKFIYCYTPASFGFPIFGNEVVSWYVIKLEGSCL